MWIPIVSLSPSLTHTHSHTHTHSLSLTQTHTHTQTHKDTYKNPSTHAQPPLELTISLKWPKPDLDGHHFAHGWTVQRKLHVRSACELWHIQLWHRLWNIKTIHYPPQSRLFKGIFTLELTQVLTPLHGVFLGVSTGSDSTPCFFSSELTQVLTPVKISSNSTPTILLDENVNWILVYVCMHSMK